MTTKKQPTAKEAFIYFTRAILSFSLSLLALYILLNPINILLNYLLHVTISYGFLYVSCVILSFIVTKPKLSYMYENTTIKKDLERVNYHIKYNCVKVVSSLVIWLIVWYFFT